jgi:hypothetical protein
MRIRSAPLLLLAIAAGAFGQAISNPGSPSSNPFQTNVSTAYLYFNKVHYAGAWSSSTTYNSQDLALYSGASYISLQALNTGNNPAAAPLWWIALPGSGGSGNVVLTTGSGAPSANCTAPSTSNLAVYLDSTNNDEWWCYATNAWKKTLSVTGSGPFQMTGEVGSLPSTPASGSVSCVFLASSALVCVDASGNDWTMLPPGATAIANATTGNAGTATALASAPSLCSTGNAPTGVLANGDATGCAAIGGGGGGSSLKGTISLPTSLLASGACLAATPVTGTGIATSDTIAISFSADPTSTTGYIAPSMLSFIPFPTANTVNVKVCNNTSAAITPGAITLNWAVGARTVASGTATLGTSAIASGACAAPVTVANAAIATTNVISATFNGDPTSSAGYLPGAMLSIISYPTAGNANFKVCNNTASSITPSAATLNWSAQ